MAIPHRATVLAGLAAPALCSCTLSSASSGSSSSDRQVYEQRCDSQQIKAPRIRGPSK